MPPPKRGKSWTADDAVGYSCSSYVEALVLMDSTGAALYEGVRPTGDDPIVVSMSFLTFLQQHPECLPRRSDTGFPICWFGFDIRGVLTTLSLAAMSCKVADACVPPIPWELWWHEHFTTPLWLDPRDMLLPSTERTAGFGMAQLERLLDVRTGPLMRPVSQAWTDAEQARRLVLAADILEG